MASRLGDALSRVLRVACTPSEGHSLAGFRVGYGALPEVADDLNGHNDACSFARPRQAMVIATLPQAGNRSQAALDDEMSRPG
jgi:hypothetical protein